MRPLVLFFCMLSTTAHAAPSVEADRAGRERAERGRAAFDAGDFRRAASLFEAAWAIDPRPGYRYSVAVALEEAGDLPGAHRALDAISDDPAAEAAQARLAARLLAEMPPVRIVGAPPGARVTFDGRALPEHGHLPSGTYALRVEHPDFHPHVSTVEIVGGQPAEVHPSLAARATHGTLRIELGTAWRARADEITPPDGPSSTEWVLAAGRYPVRLSGPDGAFVQTVRLEPGAEMLLEAPVAVDRRSGSTGWWLVGGGGGALAGGLALTLWSLVLDGQAADALACAEREDETCRLADARRVEDRAVVVEQASAWVYGVGGAALVIGVLLLVFDDPPPVRVGPSGVGAAF